VWWFLGHHGPLVHGTFGEAKVGYRTGALWIDELSHPLILLAGLALAAVLWLSRRRQSGSGALISERDALLALALLLLMRCLLDTWDAVYYPLPFIFALLAWEVRGPTERPPVLALTVTALAWISFQWSPEHVSPDAQAALFLAWTLPLVALLAFALYAPGRVLVERRKLLGQAREQLVPVVANQG
jgi:hypothetical protein